MNYLLFYATISFYLQFSVVKTGLSERHVRNKRFLVFPEGSTFAMAFCMASRSPLLSGMWDEGVLFGVAYELPNDTSIFGKPRDLLHVIKRRNRRDLYQKMEIIMDSLGYDGRSCVFRALCEASRNLIPNESTIFEKIFRIVFDFPQQKILKSEPEVHRLYHWAHRKGRENSDLDCSETFPKCPISLLDLAMGYYSEFNQEEKFSSALSSE